MSLADDGDSLGRDGVAAQGDHQVVATRQLNYQSLYDEQG
jgi:hypothetical protein